MSTSLNLNLNLIIIIIIYFQLNNRFRYPYYSRLVPSDMYQAQTLVDIMIRYGWTYVTVLASKGSYGERGKEVSI